MKFGLTMLKRAVPLACAALAFAGSAQAALQDRDLDGDTVVDAFYDTDLDITWLRDANVNGPMTLNESATWALNLSFAGYDDWRLPNGDWCVGYDCTSSKMGHLWYVELGNAADGPANVGGFQNAQVGDSDVYWSSFYGLGYTSVLYFQYGYQTSVGVGHPGFAMAVHPGEVGAAVPEPETYALMLAGLAGLALATRRQRRR